MCLFPSAMPDGQPVAAYATSPAMRRLYHLQRDHPLFNPGLLQASAPAGLSDVLFALQAELPARYISLPDLSKVSAGTLASAPSSGSATPSARIPDSSAIAAQYVAVRARALCAEARREVLHALDGPLDGGAAAATLRDSGRADTCWRDLNSLLRVVGYACVAPAGVSAEGAGVLREVYVELGLSVELAEAGLRGARRQALQEAVGYAMDFDADGVEVAHVLETAFECVQRVVVG